MVERAKAGANKPTLITTVSLPNGNHMEGLQARAFINLLTAESPEAPFNIGAQWRSLFPGLPYNRTRIANLYNKIKGKLGDLGEITRYDDPDHIPQFADKTLSSHYMTLTPGVSEGIKIATKVKPIIEPPRAPEILRIELPNNKWAVGNEARLYQELLKDHLNPASAIPSPELYRLVFGKEGYSKGSMNSLVYALRRKLDDSGINIRMVLPNFKGSTKKPHSSVYIDAAERIQAVKKQQSQKEFFKERKSRNVILDVIARLGGLGPLEDWDEEGLKELHEQAINATDNPSIHSLNVGKYRFGIYYSDPEHPSNGRIVCNPRSQERHLIFTTALFQLYEIWRNHGKILGSSEGLFTPRVLWNGKPTIVMNLDFFCIALETTRRYMEWHQMENKDKEGVNLAQVAYPLVNYLKRYMPR